MKKLILLNLIILILCLNTFAYAQDYPYGDDLIKKPLESLHKKTVNIVPPFIISADEETRSTLPGIFTDITRSDEERKKKVEPDKGRAFYYGFHRTLQSLTDIGNETPYTDQLNEMMKSKQVVAYVTAAQTQPAAAAGLHYGTMNAQLTLVNQQLSHQAYFEQLSHLPGGAQMLQSMYTGCLGQALAKGTSFAEAHRACIGDKAEAGKKGKDEIAKITDIVDHEDYAGDKPDIAGAGKDEKIACTDLIFQQQKNGETDQFKKEFKNWFGDEITVIKKVDKANAGAAVGKERELPEYPLAYKYKKLVDERYQQFGNLMIRVCQAQYETGAVATDLKNLLKSSQENIWVKEGKSLKNVVGLLSIEGYDFNTMIADALNKSFFDLSNKKGDSKIDCQEWKKCYDEVYPRDSGSKFRAYDPQNSVPIQKLCVSMHDYAEGVALGYITEIIARVRRIIMDFTAATQNSDARSCGMRIIHDQIKTTNLEEVQFLAIQHLVKTGHVIFKDRSKESGNTANAVAGTQAANKEKAISE
jgi:hypothetical protein